MNLPTFPPSEPLDVLHDFDAWATVSACLLKRSAAQRAEILRLFAVEHTWDQADAGWSHTLRQDIANDDMTRAERYAAICAVEMKRRKAQSDGLPGSSSRDFRNAIMYGESTPPPEQGAGCLPTSVPQPKQSFIRALAPSAHRPRPPMRGQQQTVMPDLAKSHAALQAVEEAINWPVEKYAYCRAQQQAFPEQRDLICANFGIEAKLMHKYVDSSWHQRLAADRRLHTKYVQLVACYVNSLTEQAQAC